MNSLFAHHKRVLFAVRRVFCRFAHRFDVFSLFFRLMYVIDLDHRAIYRVAGELPVLTRAYSKQELGFGCVCANQVCVKPIRIVALLGKNFYANISIIKFSPGFNFIRFSCGVRFN